MIQTQSPRGFTLLIAVILSSVLVSITLSLIDIAYKQVVLASTATQSEYAFYNADSALECALYWDQKFNAFDYSAPLSSNLLVCGNLPVTSYSVTSLSGSTKQTKFTIQCPAGGTAGTVTVEKNSSGGTSLFGNGYNTCSTNDNRRIERGLKATYGL